MEEAWELAAVSGANPKRGDGKQRNTESVIRKIIKHLSLSNIVAFFALCVSIVSLLISFREFSFLSFDRNMEKRIVFFSDAELDRISISRPLGEQRSDSVKMYFPVFLFSETGSGVYKDYYSSAPFSSSEVGYYLAEKEKASWTVFGRLRTIINIGSKVSRESKVYGFNHSESESQISHMGIMVDGATTLSEYVGLGEFPVVLETTFFLNGELFVDCSTYILRFRSQFELGKAKEILFSSATVRENALPLGHELELFYNAHLYSGLLAEGSDGCEPFLNRNVFVDG